MPQRKALIVAVQGHRHRHLGLCFALAFGQVVTLPLRCKARPYMFDTAISHDLEAKAPAEQSLSLNPRKFVGTMQV